MWMTQKHTEAAVKRLHSKLSRISMVYVQFKAGKARITDAYVHATAFLNQAQSLFDHPGRSFMVANGNLSSGFRECFRPRPTINSFRGFEWSQDEDDNPPF